MTHATIYHNPDCGTSRNALALLRHAGADVEVIEYLQTPPSRETIQKLASDMNYSVRDLLRRKGTPYDALGLDDLALSDDQLLDAIEVDPILLNRPIIITDEGTALCRPSELVLDLLPSLPKGGLLKDDGDPFLKDEPVTDFASLRAALEAANLPADDVEDGNRRFFRFKTLDGEDVGFGGFETYGKDALIRSVVIEPDKRGQGLGKNLTQLLLTRAFNERARNAYLLTTAAAPFFERIGFKEIKREDAPESIRTTKQAASLCPSTAPLLVRSISL